MQTRLYFQEVHSYMAIFGQLSEILADLYQKVPKNGKFLQAICYNHGSIKLPNILRKALTGQERI